MARLLSEAKYDGWLIYAASLPALLTLAGLGVTAALAWHNQALWYAATIRGNPDHYVQGWPNAGSPGCRALSFPS